MHKRCDNSDITTETEFYEAVLYIVLCQMAHCITHHHQYHVCKHHSHFTLSKIFAANFSEQVVESFPSDISTGIYYGWACVGNGDVHKMVLSIGWNPFYKNIKKSVETHIIHTFKEDFYGEILSIVIIGYIRPEKNFDSLEALISAIQEDIEEANRQLDLPEHLKLKDDNFFYLPEGKIVNGH
uniref:Riboflavin kinase n=1 Tax=Athene cunicularia TaxID=194338 RepID=A0A663N393_ATHCN